MTFSRQKIGPLGASLLLCTIVGLGPKAFGADAMRAPGNRPLPGTVHALVGGRVVVKPGVEIEKATIVLREGRIEAVGADVAAPPDAQVREMAGTTIYAGFIDAHVVFTKGRARSGGSEGPPIEALDELTSGAGAGFLGVDSAAVGGSSKTLVTPERRMSREYAPDPKALEALRAEGFTVGNVAPERGLIRGVSTLVALGTSDPNEAIIRPETFQHVLLDVPDRRSPDEEGERGPEPYPHSLMGVISAVRQTFFDTQFQAADFAHFAAHPKDRPRPAFSASLDALAPAARKAMPVVFEPASMLMVDRAGHLARELGLHPVILATGQEWRRPELARGTGAAFIVPVDFPEVPKLPAEDDWLAVPYSQLRAWDHAPGNAAHLRREGIDIALSTHALAKKSRFRPNARLAIARGLSEPDAIAALTVSPARLCGVSDQLGTIEPGKLGYLTVVEKGRYFDESARVREVWIDGRPFPAPLTDAAKKDGEAKAKEKPKLRGELTAVPEQKDRGPLLAPPAVVIKSATVWTSGPQGRQENAGVLIVDGKIRAIGALGEIPPGAHVIDRPGIHITPGLIDCHSHSMVLGGVNEATVPSSAMVRVADVVNSESETIHQQLAGGLTTANLLHGSANPIGGQNCVIKLRDGAAPEELKLAGAPGGIKFALGENVKQANWGAAFKYRFPQTRMGVPAFHANRFSAAQHYAAAREKQRREGGPPVRRDLELEAIAEIIRGERLIHCHSYRQDEIVAFLRVMESFGVRVGTLQHILEGYKVADEIAKHGAGASAFADWWAYKFEVYDAIPYAGSIMRERGVNVSFNSDSSDHARRLNLEAAKAVKYGGTPEAEALKFVTINPARQLGIDARVGSLEVGKDGDFAVWSGHPLSTASVCLETWIDGKQYFEREAAQRRAEGRNADRLALIGKAKKLASEPSADAAAAQAQTKFFQRALEDRQALRCAGCCLDHDELTWKN